MYESTDIVKKIKGERSYEYLRNIYYLAFVYEKAKNFVEAKVCCEKALELMKIYIIFYGT